MARLIQEAPDNLIGLVWLTQTEDGVGAAHREVDEFQGEAVILPPRRLVAQALRSLADALDQEADAMDGGSSR